jgi:hypothetical protein
MLILLGDYRTPTIPIPKPPPFGLTELEIETLEKIECKNLVIFCFCSEIFLARRSQVTGYFYLEAAHIHNPK